VNHLAQTHSWAATIVVIVTTNFPLNKAASSAATQHLRSIISRSVCQFHIIAFCFSQVGSGMEEEVQKRRTKWEGVGPCSFQVSKRRDGATVHMERKNDGNGYIRFVFYQFPASDSLP
jgi:hypothetical protein